MQVDVRLLPPDSFGAAMQYFTGSKAHNVALRQRALKMGYTLNEYSLAELETEQPVAGKTEEEIYAKLKLDYIPPEMRENLRRNRCRGKTHTAQSDTQSRYSGRRSHAHRRNRRPQHHRRNGRGGAEDEAINTWPSPTTQRIWPSPMAWTTRAQSPTFSEFARQTTQSEGIKIFAGIEVDILADGDLDLSDDVLAQMDIVIASVHSVFQSGAGEDDRAAAESNRESQHVAHRPSHRPHPASPRRLPVRHGRRTHSRGEEQSRHGAEFLPRPSRSERSSICARRNNTA